MTSCNIPLLVQNEEGQNQTGGKSLLALRAASSIPGLGILQGGGTGHGATTACLTDGTERNNLLSGCLSVFLPEAQMILPGLF